MPEGDTIRRLAEAVRTRFAGQTVRRDTFRHPRLATATFVGAVLLDAASFGKHLFLRFDDGRSMHVHLLMQGRVAVGGSAPAMRGRVGDDETWRKCFELWFDSGPLVGIDIPLLHVVPTAEEHGFIDHLGPDLCADHFEAERDLTIGRNRMLTEPDAPLGGALLEQRHLAGFGNIYAVETPFICGVSPYRPIGTIDGLLPLLHIGAALIRTNAARGPQNTTGRRLADSDHWILSGDRRSCRVCSGQLERRRETEVAWQRRTVRCPTCQPDDSGSVDLDRAERLLRLHPAHRSIPWGDWGRVGRRASPI
ncbi:MAG: DNA-formamidopyrimidine glycosylase family protein [Actinomycetota bacterium]